MELELHLALPRASVSTWVVIFSPHLVFLSSSGSFSRMISARCLAKFSSEHRKQMADFLEQAAKSGRTNGKEIFPARKKIYHGKKTSPSMIRKSSA